MLDRLFPRSPGQDGSPEQMDTAHVESVMNRASAPQAVTAEAVTHAAWLEATTSTRVLAGVEYGPERTAARDRVIAELRGASRAQQRAAAAYLLARARLDPNASLIGYQDMGDTILMVLARKRLELSPAAVAWMFACVRDVIKAPRSWQGRYLLRLPLFAAEKLSADQLHLLQPQLGAVTAQLTDKQLGLDAEVAKMARRLNTLLAALAPDAAASIPAHLLDGGDDFGLAARQALLARFPEAQVAAALDVLTGYGTSVKPTMKWRKQVAATTAASNGAPVVEVSRMLLAQASTHETSWVTHHWSGRDYREPVFVQNSTGQLLRAAVWVTALGTPVAERAQVVSEIGAAVVHCGVGFGGSGGMSRCSVVANAGLAALAELAATDPALSEDVVTQFARAQSKIANKNLRKAVDAALTAAAVAAGMTTGQLLERSVPTFGLGWDGRGEVELCEEHTALLELATGAGGAKLTITLRTADGRTTTSVPAKVKENHASDLAELRAIAKEAKKAASVQRGRLEDLLVDERTFDVADWVAYYVEHPVVGLYARQLLWQVRSADAPGTPEASWSSGLPQRAGDRWLLADHDGTTTPVRLGDLLRLWHPIREPLPAIRAWREHLTDTGTRQPFKQAFREIYLLTPAEVATGTYSNRFAAHILRYPQAGALIRTRGWSGQHLGYWDGGWDGHATKEMGDSGWRASFYYDLVEDGADNYETPSLCSTDQVRFERREGEGTRSSWAVRPLDQVPPLVLSEAMRDVDLFVGVTSVAGDPAWTDRGTERFADYWEATSFGNLNESALMRRDALERLLPRTKLADRAELVDKFLVIRGHLRDYKIHLGSGNILMTPADTYLCIVPARGAKDPQVFLPFEEDGGKLAVILSKAFLLAEDTSITDTTITQQLRHGL